MCDCQNNNFYRADGDEDGEKAAVAGGMISGIIQGIGGIVQGVGGIANSNVDDVCGKKPGLFANKSQKDKYQECLTKSAEAKIALMKSKAETDRVTDESSSSNKKIIMIAVISTVVIVAIVVTVVIVSKKTAE